MAQFQNKAEAVAESQRMLGWDNIRVVEDEGIVGIDGEYIPNVYILATDPISHRAVVFDGSDSYAREVN